MCLNGCDNQNEKEASQQRGIHELRVRKLMPRDSGTVLEANR